MSDFLPTHNCFDDAVEFFIALGSEETPREEIDKYVLVHGICIAPDGTDYVHAWVEHADDFVVQAGLVDGVRRYLRIERVNFYESWNVREFTVYTLDELTRACERSRGGTSGPWLPKYQALQQKNARRKGPRVWRVGDLDLQVEGPHFNTQTGKFEDAR